MIRVPLGWSNVDNLTQKVNPQQTVKLNRKDSRQTVEIRTPDGSAFPQFVLASLALAAEWGLNHPNESLELADKYYVSGNIHSGDNSHLQDLPTCCVDSADILTKSKELYIRDGIFTDKIIAHFVDMLKAENDKGLDRHLVSLNEDEKMTESRKVMHRAIHKY